MGHGITIRFGNADLNLVDCIASVDVRAMNSAGDGVEFSLSEDDVRYIHKFFGEWLECLSS